MIKKEGTLPKDTNEEKVTDYTFNGKPIVLTKQRGRPLYPRAPASFISQEKKLECCTLYCVYGDVEQVEKLTGIDARSIRAMKEEPWWAEIQKQVYLEQNEKLASKINTTLDIALVEINERLTNGDFIFDQKNACLLRKPIDAKVLVNMFDSLSHRRSQVRKDTIVEGKKIEEVDRLTELRKAFEELAKNTLAKTIEGEVVA